MAVYKLVSPPRSGAVLIALLLSVTTSAIAIDKESTSEQRAQAVIDLKHLAEKIGRLKVEIRELEENRVLYERELQDYRATVER